MPKQSTNTEQKIYVFIDVANVWNAQKTMSQFLDYQSLKSNIALIISTKIESTAKVHEVFYYEAYPE